MGTSGAHPQNPTSNSEIFQDVLCNGNITNCVGDVVNWNTYFLCVPSGLPFLSKVSPFFSQHSFFVISWTSPLCLGKPLKFKVCHILCVRNTMGERRGYFNFKVQSKERLAGVEQQTSSRKHLILPDVDRKLFQGSTLFQLFLIHGQKIDIQSSISENRGSDNKLC